MGWYSIFSEGWDLEKAIRIRARRVTHRIPRGEKTAAGWPMSGGGKHTREIRSPRAKKTCNGQKRERGLRTEKKKNRVKEGSTTGPGEKGVGKEEGVPPHKRPFQATVRHSEFPGYKSRRHPKKKEELRD